MHTLENITAARVLRRLHADAQNDYQRIGIGTPTKTGRTFGPQDFEFAYLPISVEQGLELHALIVENGLKHVVEFGTSFGISTLYLADAVRHTGGHVVSTELMDSKTRIAAKNLAEAGLISLVDLRVGDAMETLKHDQGPIDLLFLDGWKDLYLPLFQLLESRFHARTVIYADNMDMVDAQPLAAYLQQRGAAYAVEVVSGGKALLARCQD